MDIPKIHIIWSDDWVQVFLDGELKYETHNIQGDEMLDLLKIPYEYQYVPSAVIQQIEQKARGRGNKWTLDETLNKIDQIEGTEKFRSEDY